MQYALRMPAPAPGPVGPGGFRIHSWKNRSHAFCPSETCFGHRQTYPDGTTPHTPASHQAFGLKVGECALLGMGEGWTGSMTTKPTPLPFFHAPNP